MKLRERIHRGSIKFKMKEKEPMPISNPPEAPPPPDGPILNTKDHELEIIPNSKYIDELDNPGKKRKAVISRKNAFKAKKLLQSKPR